MITPVELGAPRKFSQWRTGQFDAVLQTVESEKRFVAHAAPTGSGKSVTSLAHALLTDARVVYLTSTRGLQSQLLGDFEEMGLVTVSGMQNYQCVAAADFGISDIITCEDGVCHSGIQCPLRSVGCLYYDAISRAKVARFVVTNYSLWYYINKFGDGLGKYDLLICDEAHDVPAALSGCMTVTLDSHDLMPLIGAAMPEYSDMDDWRAWGRFHGSAISEKSDALAAKMRNERAAGKRISRTLSREVKMYRRISRDLTTLAGAQGEWVIEWIIPNKRVAFTPIWPAKYAESSLFLGIPKVLLLSATLRPYTMHLLGIGVDKFDFFESPSTFPPASRPVYWIPTIGLSYRSTEVDLKFWLARIDEIISGRLDRKGLIHTVSYRLCKYVLENSKHRSIMMSHTAKTTRSVIEQFKRAKPPAVLVSPAITTGYDFPASESRFNILGKLPFPDLTSALLQARMKTDPMYLDYMVAQSITQASGRTTRSESDWSETFVVDDNFGRFMRTRRALFPTWFLAACKTLKQVPPAPEIKS
jgi:ATP-dependent DNA helicase DinG